MGPSATWRTSGDAILITRGDGACEAAADDSAAGAHRVSLGGASLAGALLKVTAPGGSLPPSAESYVRGVDWVSTHPAAGEWPFRVQLYRSLLPLRGGVALTLTVSLQTALLDTRPRLEVSSRLEGHGFDADGVSALSLAGDATLLVTPHPTDAGECSVRVGEDGSVTHEFAPPFLEKGVIRRVRFAAIALEGEVDLAAAHAAIDEWAGAPLPLTA